eukprot:CAMPEP_0201578690 /NCGR_PEP_ID=MMETSP0190_2-20130828/25708_1 /ASSEMBLY_ACC=CAM_ASM_000263 /TAXON_ID=37353 /ORGANISM="Rosalina sp." /LENGTH=108 /DNA_ID=CAMNT_0048012167 /DNA_START=16 /DNA_END=338 /DNA_ORIENTATION=+
MACLPDIEAKAKKDLQNKQRQILRQQRRGLSGTSATIDAILQTFSDERKYINEHTKDFDTIALTYFFGTNQYKFKVRSYPFANGHFKKAYEAVFIQQDRTKDFAPNYS